MPGVTEKTTPVKFGIGCFTILACRCHSIDSVSCHLSPTDVDECSDGTDACDIRAVCLDTEGSYDCVCQTGYRGDGYACTGE